MQEFERGLLTPPEIIKTWEILAPKGTTLKQKIASMDIAVELYKARGKESTTKNSTQKSK